MIGGINNALCSHSLLYVNVTAKDGDFLCKVPLHDSPKANFQHESLFVPKLDRPPSYTSRSTTYASCSQNYYLLKWGKAVVDIFVTSLEVKQPLFYLGRVNSSNHVQFLFSPRMIVQVCKTHVFFFPYAPVDVNESLTSRELKVQKKHSLPISSASEIVFCTMEESIVIGILETNILLQYLVSDKSSDKGFASTKLPVYSDEPYCTYDPYLKGGLEKVKCTTLKGTFIQDIMTSCHVRPTQIYPNRLFEYLIY